MACLWTREGANLFCVFLGKKEIALEILSEAIGNTNKNMKRLLWIVIAQWLYFLKCYVNFRHNRTSENCRTAILQGIFLTELCSSDAPRTWAWQCCRDHAGQSKENSLHQSHRHVGSVFFPDEETDRRGEALLHLFISFFSWVFPCENVSLEVQKIH